MMLSTIDPGAAISVAIGLILGAAGSLWFINRAIADDEHLDPAVRKRIRRALLKGLAVADPAEANVAVGIAAAHRKALRAARATLVGYVALATGALIIAVIGGDSLVIGMAALIWILAIVAIGTSVILGRRIGRAEIANKELFAKS